MKTNTLIFGVGALALICSATNLSASVLFDSLPNPTPTGTINLDEDVAQSFDVGPIGATLTSVVISMATEKDAGSGPGAFTVQLVADNGSGNSPGTVLATLAGNSDPATAANYTYTPTATTTLAANTAYFIELSFETGGEAEYKVNGAGKNSGTDSLGAYGYEGSSWVQAIPPNTEAISMQINATLSPVPEPSGWAAISAVTLGAVWVVKRRLTPVRS